MKIRKLVINEHKHLKDLEFDFTYPEGHEKAGQPLEKICIIGQSATGKTSLLQFIKQNVSQLSKVRIVNEQEILADSHSEIKGEAHYEVQNDLLIAIGSGIQFNDTSYEIGYSNGSVRFLLNEGLKLIYFGAEMIARDLINILNKNPTDLLDKEFGRMNDFKDRKSLIEYDFEFSEEVNEHMWFGLLVRIADYRRRFTQFASQLISRGIIGDSKKLNSEFQNWANENENPLTSFSKYFDPILEKLNLEVDLVDTGYFIPVKSKITNETIPFSGLSTGTKSLLLSLFPLSELDTTDAMILVDEPERSLFPDMQVELVSHYRNISPDSQLIIATHSPFIAAAFEPEERFILYFDEEGKVAVRRGESPIGDDPNDMLRNDFRVDYYNSFGKDAYKQYLELKQALVTEQDKEIKKKLIVEIAELGDKYNF